MQRDREPVALGQAFYPFREGGSKVQIALVPTGQAIPIDFRVQPVNHPSLSNAGYFECVGAQLLHPLALTTKQVDGSKVYLDPASRLDLSIQIPGMLNITGKIRPGLYEERKMEWWYYDASLWLPRLKTTNFLPPPLPLLATPGFLGSDPNYRVGESYGGKLLVKDDPGALADIKVTFSLTDQVALPRVLAAKRELWENVWNSFGWERLYGSVPEKGLVNILDSGILDPEVTDVILRLIGTEPTRAAEELIIQAEVVRTSAQRWAVRRRSQLYRIFREQEDSFRM